MKKEENPIKVLLNQIYTAPDLGEKVFEFINPHIVNAYGLLELDSYNKKNNQPRIFQSEEDLNNLNTILYRELPGIFNIYTKLPLKYRNTNKLKTGKTHRETLIENMVSLVNNMVTIENLQYEEIDKEAIVKTKLLNNKYSQYNNASLDYVLEGKEKSNQPQNELQFENDFNYDNFKKTLNPEDLNIKDINFNQEKTSEVKIQFHKGIIEYKVKDKMKAFMKGVYQAGNKFINDKNYFSKTKLGLKIATAPIYYPLKGFSNATDDTKGAIIVIGGCLAIVGCFTLGFHYSAEANHISRNLKEIYAYSNAETLALKEINMTVLNEYAKNHPGWSIHYGIRDDKEVAVIDIKSNIEDCVKTAENLKDYLPYSGKDKETYNNYKINQHELPVRQKLNNEAVNTVCALPENNIHIELNLTQYPKETTKPKL